MTSHEIGLLCQLEPLLAEQKGPYGPTCHPHFTSPEVQISRAMSVSGHDMYFDTWVTELIIPYTAQTCASDEGHLLRIRRQVNVSYQVLCYVINILENI